MQALERLSRSEEAALLELVRANDLDEAKLACFMTRQQASGRGRHSEKGGFSILSGQAFNISASGFDRSGAAADMGRRDRARVFRKCNRSAGQRIRNDHES